MPIRLDKLTLKSREGLQAAEALCELRPKDREARKLLNEIDEKRGDMAAQAPPPTC